MSNRVSEGALKRMDELVREAREDAQRFERVLGEARASVTALTASLVDASHERDALAAERDDMRKLLGDLLECIPDTYGEAQMAGIIDPDECEGHEWDNRTRAENAVWLLRRRTEERDQAREKTSMLQGCCDRRDVLDDEHRKAIVSMFAETEVQYDNRSWNRVIAGLKHVIMAPICYSSNDEAGDHNEDCGICGDSREPLPHTWKHCASELKREKEYAVNQLINEQVEKGRVLDELRAMLTLCETGRWSISGLGMWFDRLRKWEEGARKILAAIDKPSQVESRDGGGCSHFKRGTPSGDCEGDGHYECRECSLKKHKAPIVGLNMPEQRRIEKEP